MKLSYEKTFSYLKDRSVIRTQYDLAGLLGITQSCIAGAKQRGNFPVKWVKKISAVSDIKEDYLLRECEKPESRAEKTIAGRIRFARKSRSIALKDFAVGMNVSRQTINAWEKKSPKRSDNALMEKIAGFLDVPIAWLLFGDKTIYAGEPENYNRFSKEERKAFDDIDPIGEKKRRMFDLTVETIELIKPGEKISQAGKATLIQNFEMYFDSLTYACHTGEYHDHKNTENHAQGNAVRIA